MANPFETFGQAREEPVFRLMDYQPKIMLKLGTKDSCPNCMEVFGLSGVMIASMDFEGVVTTHVPDPIKSINCMLESPDLRDAWQNCQVRAYLLLLRTHLLTPQPDDWKKNPLL